MRKFLGKIFGTFELFTMAVVDYEWNDEEAKLEMLNDPAPFPAYINIAKREKKVRLVYGQDFELIAQARMSNSLSEMNKANSYVLDNPTEMYVIKKQGKENGYEAFLTDDNFGGHSRKFIIEDQVVYMYHDFDSIKNTYKKARAFIAK